MKTIKTNISGVEVLIQVEDDGAANDDFLGEDIAGRCGISDDYALTRKEPKAKPVINNAFDHATQIMFALADGCVKQFKSKENAPSELEIEYSLTLDGKAELWIVNLGKTSNIKVKMKWLNA